MSWPVSCAAPEHRSLIFGADATTVVAGNNVYANDMGIYTDDGITIYNLWETEDGRHRMAEDPEIQEALRNAGFPKPEFKGYEVLSRRTSGEYAKELSRRVAEEVWSAGNLDVIDELFASDYHGWTPTDGEIRGPAGFRELVERYRAAFSGTTMTAVTRKIAACSRSVMDN